MSAETPTPLTDAVKARVEKYRNEVGLEYSTFLFQMVGELSDHARQLERANAALTQEILAAKEIAASAIIRLQNLGENTFQLDLVDSLRNENAALAEQLAEARKDEKRNIAAKIMQGFCANPAVFAANSNCGWSLVNCKDEDLVGYAMKLAGHVMECAAIDAASEGKGRG